MGRFSRKFLAFYRVGRYKQRLQNHIDRGVEIIWVLCPVHKRPVQSLVVFRTFQGAQLDDDTFTDIKEALMLSHCSVGLMHVFYTRYLCVFQFFSSAPDETGSKVKHV